MDKLIDLSHVIEDNMPVYPGDAETNLCQTKYLSADNYNNYRLEIVMHSGTHIDSPMHLTESTEYISEAPLGAFIASGCILDVRNQPVIKAKAEYGKLIKDNSILLLYTGWDRFYGKAEYYENHPSVSPEFCRLLLEKNIKTLGIDMPSPDMYPFEVHKLLFKNNIYIIENLTNLDKLIYSEKFEVISFPLRIKADSAMTRAVARII